MLAVLAGLAFAAVVVWVGGLAYVAGVALLAILTLVLGICTLVWEHRHRSASGVLGVWATFVGVVQLDDGRWQFIDTDGSLY